jgi:hypothetical protein
MEFIYVGDGILAFINNNEINKVQLVYLEFNDSVTVLITYEGVDVVSGCYKVGDLLYTGMVGNQKSYLMVTNVLTRTYKSYLMPYNLVSSFIWGL